MDSGEARKIFKQHNKFRASDGSVVLKVDHGRLSLDWGTTPSRVRDKEGVHDVPEVGGVTVYKHESGKKGQGSSKREGEDGVASASDEEEWDSDWEDSEEEEGMPKKQKAEAKTAAKARQIYNRTRILVTEQQRQDDKPLRASFSLRYLAALTRHPLSSRVVFQLSAGMPLCIKYVLKNETKRVGTLCCYVAPKIDE